MKPWWNGRALLCLLLIALLPGCALRQELHDFPQELSAMLGNEACDCARIEFTDEEKAVMSRTG